MDVDEKNGEEKQSLMGFPLGIFSISNLPWLGGMNRDCSDNERIKEKRGSVYLVITNKAIIIF